MRRTVGFVVLWFAAGAAATTVAWLGVATVSDQLAGSGSHPDPLTGDEIAAELAAGPSTTTTALPDATTSTTVVSPIDGTTTTTTTPTTVAPPATTVAPPPVQPIRRSYDLDGGTATLRFSRTGVTVDVATPAPGFTVEISESHDGGVRVEFESDDHRSRLDAWWDGGPRDEVREEDR